MGLGSSDWYGVHHSLSALHCRLFLIIIIIMEFHILILYMHHMNSECIFHWLTNANRWASNHIIIHIITRPINNSMQLYKTRIKMSKNSFTNTYIAVGHYTDVYINKSLVICKSVGTITTEIMKFYWLMEPNRLSATIYIIIRHHHQKEVTDRFITLYSSDNST